MVDTASPETIHALTLGMIFNYLAVRLNGPEAAGREITINFVLPDTNQTAWLRLENGALSHSVGRTAADPDATVTIDREVLDADRLRPGRSRRGDRLGQGQGRAGTRPAGRDRRPARLLQSVVRRDRAVIRSYSALLIASGS